MSRRAGERAASRCGHGSCSGCSLVAAAGLLVADAVTYAALRSSLLDRVDQTLDDDHPDAARYAAQNCLGGAERRAGLRAGRPPGRAGRRPRAGHLRRAATDDRSTTCTLPAQEFGQEAVAPKLPKTIDVPDTTATSGLAEQRALLHDLRRERRRALPRPRLVRAGARRHADRRHVAAAKSTRRSAGCCGSRCS